MTMRMIRLRRFTRIVSWFHASVKACATLVRRLRSYRLFKNDSAERLAFEHGRDFLIAKFCLASEAIMPYADASDC